MRRLPLLKTIHVQIMNIFITGVNGFIGSNLARYLLRMCHHISGSVRKTSDLSFLNELKVDLFTGDLNDEEFLLNCFKGQDIIYHVAALASDWGSINTFYNTNVRGTMNVAKAASKAGVKRLIFVSSTAVCGLTGYRYRTEKDVRPKNNFPYASTKREAEDWLWKFSHENNLPITIIQPANVFGPYDRTFFIKFAQALEKGRMTFINKGKAWTCPTYIENLTEALWMAANNENAIGETFIISDGLEINWRQFIQKICQELKVHPPRFSVSFHFGYMLASLIEVVYKLFKIYGEPPITRYRIRNVGLDYHFSIEKAKSILGYSPRIDLDEAIKRTVQWYRKYREERNYEHSSG